MKVVILAGGRGTRLQPLTNGRPKPLLPVANRSLLDYQLERLERCGLRDVVLSLNYRSGMMRWCRGDARRSRMRIRYAIEPWPLGTAGALRYAARSLRGERLLVLNGDVLSSADLGRLVAAHERAAAAVTIALARTVDPSPYGLVVLNPGGRVSRFVEKPQVDAPGSYTVNAGIYVIEPSVLDRIPAGRPVSLEHDLYPSLLKAGLHVHGEEVGGYWLDVGTLARYLQANFDLVAGRSAARPAGRAVAPGQWVADGVWVSPRASLCPPLSLGPGVRIGAGAKVGPFAIVGARTRVGAGATLAFTVVQEACSIGSGARVEGCLIDRRVRVAAGVKIERIALAARSTVMPGSLSYHFDVSAETPIEGR